MSSSTMTTPSSEHSYPSFDGPWMPRTTAEWYAMRQLAPAQQTFGAHPAAAARRPPSHHPPAQRSDRSSVAARRASPHRARISKVGSSGNAGMPVGLNMMSPSTPLKRRTTTAGTTSTRTRSSMAPPSTQHPQHSVQAARYPVPPAQARLIWGPMREEDPWASLAASRPITWHAASNVSSSQPASSNLDASSYLAPQMDPWNMAGPAHAWAPRGNHEPPTPSLYPASETTSPILPYSPSISNLGLNDLDLTQIYDATALDLGAPAYDGLPTTWLAGPPPKTDPMMLDPVSSTMALTQPILDPSHHHHHHHHHSALNPSNLSYLATPSSPEMGSFLPIQRPEVDTRSQVPELPPSSSLSSEDDSDDKELVGMGLYDDVPSRAALSKGRLGNGTGRATGKGLKLEETWAPPSSASAASSRTEAATSVPNTSRAAVAPVIADGMVIAPNALLDPTAMGLDRSFFLDDGDLLDTSRHFSIDGLYPALEQPSNHLFNYI